MSPGGTITLAGRSVSRLGLGTMRLTGAGTWGPPPDPEHAADLLRRAVDEVGITHIDTADAYGPHDVEQLLRRALHPYPRHVLIATKVGLIRPAPNVWVPLGRPEYLRAAVEGSLRRLGMDRLELCYLHRVDPLLPLAEQIGELGALQAEGKIGHIGLSKVTDQQIAQAQEQVSVAAVQNCLNLGEPTDPALAYCARHTIPYVPYRPLNAGRLSPRTALAWLMNQGDHVAPIPGTSSLDHLLDLVRAVDTGARAVAP